MNLELLIRKRDYYNDAAQPWMRNIWSRPEALDHFTKYHRHRLASAGALIKIGRDYFVNTEKFPSVAIEILGIYTPALSMGSDIRKEDAMS